MKKILIAITAVLCSHTLLAQVKEGTILYERKMDMHRRIQDEQMKAMMPQFRTSKHQLLFSDSVSIYKAVQEEEAPDPFADGGGNRVMFRMSAGEGEQYRNFSNQRFIESRELGAKTYIIEDTIRQQPWKLTDETKTILNYSCKKATRKTERGQEVEAWYTEAIPCPAGPEGFASLPGAILQLNINNDEIVYVATAVSDKVNAKELKEPSKGKKVNRAEFAKLMQEMYGSPGQGGGNRVIRIMN
ncbi:GLPGLI family protein [Aridibaculum aurantiacum]|uniref:GLPGLI family protein n=1 Tax=Aridibaculum aurantiacum TaxID=2810307 RepID=UPI001A95CD78|nr:GLPGLI family protein [Aridibaculum aurantiacum]